jgi:signal transduction histidine kinase
MVAEKNIAVIRFLVIVFNVGIYWGFLHPQGVPWLALAISVVALAYGAFVIFNRPYRRFPILRTGWWTASTDGALILLWIHATGDAASPFHLLWYLSIMAVTFRFSWRAILVTAVAYAATYVGLIAVVGQLPDNGLEVAIRAVYILLLGGLGALLSRESIYAFEERFGLRQEVQRLELDRLKEMDRFKTDFINTAAHELNTPMTPLLLQLHVLRSHVPAESPGHRAVQVLDRNLLRLSLLVKDMLDAARLQSGRLALQLAPLDLGKVLEDTAETYAAEATAKGVDLQWDSAHGLEARVDRLRIAQVLGNLVSNAIKFTPEGGQVHIRGTRQDGTAQIVVQDSGLGLTQEQASKLFRPFSRLHPDEGVPGTGLGLYISRGIVEAHGGTISCHSEGPQKGTRFVVRLPIQQA